MSTSKKSLTTIINKFESSTSANSTDVNDIRKIIFKSFKENNITEEERVEFLKKLYNSADEKGIFFLKIMNIQEHPENEGNNEDEEEESYEEEQSYQESYEESYEESYDDE